jgi:protein SCO1/2
MKHRPTILLLVVAVAVIATVFAVYSQLERQTTARHQLDSSLQFGGDFHMVDDEGRPVSQQDILGRPTVMFFGFTFCPDVCPTTLANLSDMMEKLGNDADRMKVVFVSVDPERDTPEKMHAYLSYFDKRIQGFTGTPEQLAAMAKEYGVYYKKVPLDGGSYTMDHTASVYLLDGTGDFVGTISIQENQEVALGKLRHLLAKAS